MSILHNILLYLSIFTPTIPLLSFLFTWNKTKQTILITILLVSVLSLFSDLSIWLPVHHAGREYLVLHVYTFLVGTVLFIYFYHLFEKRKFIVIVTQVLFTSLCVLSTLFWGGLHHINAIPNIALNILIMGFSLAYFIKAINELKFKRITDDLNFWLNFGLLLLYGTTLILSLFETTLRDNNNSLLRNTWLIICIANIMFNTILTIGIWKTKRILV